MNTSEHNQELPDEAPENETPKPARKTNRWRVVALVSAIATVVSCIAYRFETMAPHQLPPDPSENAAMLRQELINRVAGRSPNYTLYRFREGIERFLISNINDPGATAFAQSEQKPRRLWQGESTALSYASHHPAPIPLPIRQFPAPNDLRRPIGSGWGGFNTEQYDHIADNPFWRVADEPVSTFSIDVDTASYSNVRRMLRDGIRPPRDAVRIEELINYFTYEYPVPDEDTPFSVNVEVASAPWDSAHRLVRIGLRGYEPPEEERPPCNLVFLVDVSGSMEPANKLPLVKRSLLYLVGRLDERDRVAICVYAGAAGQVLPPTLCVEKGIIRDAIARLEAGGSTNGGEGIRLAYTLAAENLRRNAVNRVILATDGDFNVGVTDRGELIRYIEEQAKEGIFLTTLGFGFGNIKDGTLEQLADKGNGNYAYIDTFDEARRVFGEKLAGTMIPIAKDVKVQVEFNPAKAAGYRLIGYENRMLTTEDFNDDAKDAGDIGAGHTVTALYEIVPAGQGVPAAQQNPLRYQSAPEVKDMSCAEEELLYVKLRYRQPKGLRSRLIEHPVADNTQAFDNASDDFRFAAAVAAFGMLLRDSPHSGGATFDEVRAWARDAEGCEGDKDRDEFLSLVDAAAMLPAHSR